MTQGAVYDVHDMRVGRLCLKGVRGVVGGLGGLVGGCICMGVHDLYM